MDANELGEKIVKTLKTIYDPEIPVDIYELGLIYDVLVNEDNEVKVIMTLTTPNCPVAESLPLDVKEKVKSIDGVENAEVEFKLSIDKDNLPYDEWKPYRNLTFNNKQFNFSEGFTDLHSISYKRIIEGKGFGINDVTPAIKLIENMINYD